MYKPELIAHYAAHWGDSYQTESFNRGPMWKLPTDFEVVRFDCTKEQRYHAYATVGLATAGAAYIEVFICSPYIHSDNTEILYSLASFHVNDEQLGLNHVVNFGKAWLPGSSMTHGLLCRPYIANPSLHTAAIGGLSVIVLWLLPVTDREREYALSQGVNALEAVYEKREVNYLDPRRRSLR